jgi:hypothetical protein
VFIAPLPSNGRLYFYYSGFQPSCYIVLSLKLLSVAYKRTAISSPVERNCGVCGRLVYLGRFLYYRNIHAQLVLLENVGNDVSDLLHRTQMIDSCYTLVDVITIPCVSDRL